MSSNADATLSISEANLSATSCDAVLADLNRLMEHGSGDRVVLDLSRLGFVDPYGMAMLTQIGRVMGSRFWEMVCRLPSDPDIESYLVRMGVLDAIREYATFDRPPHTERQPLRNEALLEICPIGRRDDVEQVLALIESRVSSILHEELGYEVREITDFKQVVSELCHNILDHSGDRGVLAAQRYVSQKQGKFAILSVCDLGMGIRESLASRFDVTRWPHSEAITRAMRKEFSREPTRGLGLYIVRQICQQYRGSLHIRSGDQRVYFRGKRSHVLPSAMFPGTQVSITLYEKSVDGT